MNILKSRALKIVTIAACLVALALGIFFALPARTANADEFVPEETVTVSSEQDLKSAVAQAGLTPTKIILGDDIEMNSITCGGEGTKYFELRILRGQNIQLDLAGHTLSVALNRWSNYTIANIGKLSIIDSSGDYKGAVVSNGYIYRDIYNGHSVENPDFSWRPTQVIWNYGELTLDANIRLERPNSTDPGTDGYYTWSGKNSSTLIHNELYVPTAEEDVNQDIYPASLTINGGNFDLYYGAGVMDHFFDIQATDVFINGGTFKNSSSVRPSYTGFLANLTSTDLTDDYTYGSYTAEQRQVLEEKIKEFRHVDIQITDGDFSDKDLILGGTSDALLYTYYYAGPGSGIGKRIDGEGYSVLISSGKFPMDLSVYTDSDHHMIHEVITQNEGKETVEDYWVVTNFSQAEKDAAAVVIEQNGVVTSYCNTFDEAWAAAMLLTSDKTIKLQKNVSTDKTLTINHLSQSTILDLNGHTLTINGTGKDLHIADDNYKKGEEGWYGTFTVRDSEDKGSGELILNYPEGSSRGGISMNCAFQFVLENGTIRLTGTAPVPASGVTSDQKKGNKYKTSLFQFEYGGSSYYYQKKDAVIIQGGNIYSELTGETPPFAGWEWRGTSYGDHYSFGLNPNEDDWEPWAGDSKIHANKLDTLKFNVESYLESHDSMKVSWNLTGFIPEDYGCVSSGNYHIITKLEEDDNYFANGTLHTQLSAAIEAAQKGDGVVTLLRDMKEEGDITIPDGVTLDLNRYLHFILEATNITLNGNNTLMNGVINANVIVKGKANFSKLTIKQGLTVEAGGDLTITDGTYDGNITKNGGNLLIMGGKFADDGDGSTTKLATYDSYIQPGFGASEVENGYRTVKGGLASLAALEWYRQAGTPSAAAAAIGYGAMAIAEVPTTYTINDTTDWLYFSSIVNSGTDDFKGDTVILGATLDFENSIFIPAGTSGHGFAGAFDGGKDEGKMIMNVKAQERYAGIFGVGDRTIQVTNLNVVDSTFISGPGYLDEVSVNWGWGAAGSIVGAGFIGNSSGLIIDGNVIDTEYGYVFLGGVIGHTFGSINLKDVSMTDSSVEQSWKSGGITGYVESGLYLDNLEVSGLKFTGTPGGWCPSGVLAGDLNSSKATVTNAKIDCPELRLNGSSSSGVAISVEGPKTDIHVDSFGAAGSFTVNLETEEDGDGNVTSESKLQVNSETLPNNLTIQHKSSDGTTTEANARPNPDGDGFTMEGDPQKVEVFFGEESTLRGSYDTLADALENTEDGDRLYLTGNVAENITIDGKEVIIDLQGFTLTGTITNNGTLTIKNGTVTTSESVAIETSGKLTLATGEKGLKVESTHAEGKAVNGEYGVADSICVRISESGNCIELALSHDFTQYTAEDNVIKLTCEHDGAVKGTITLNADDFTYDGKEHPATVAVDGLDIKAESIVVTYMRKNAADEYEPFSGVPVESGSYKASITVEDVTVSVEFSSKRVQVVVGGIESVTAEYSGSAVTVEVGSFTLTSLSGEEFPTTGKEIHVTITIEESKYQAGEYTVALITSISLGGEYANNFELSLIGQQAFTKLIVNQINLYVSIDETGKVSYDGFVGGEDESVLGGELVMTYDEDGAVHLSGLESNNYNIIYRDGVVLNTGADLTALWVILGALAAITTVAAVTISVKKSRRK